MEHLFSLISLPFDLFARAGGGGSSGGGGGGSGGSGGGESILFFLGYIPMHFLGAAFAKISKKHAVLVIILNIVGWIVALLYAMMWVLIWGWMGAAIGALALLGMAAGLYGLFSKLRQSKQVKAGLLAAAAQDKAWDEATLVAFAKDTFLKYQQDWSSFNKASIQTYTTPAYFYHSSLLLYTLELMGRRDEMTEVMINDATIVSAQDAADNNQDSFTIGFIASAVDKLIEKQTEVTLFTDRSSFSEYWTFRRSGATWLLDDISQSTADIFSLNEEMRQFAAQHNFCYSEDMGWLFIPKRGQLFGGAKFGTSDINNHVVGLYNNQLLIQLYSYVKDPQAKSTQYVIAQANVPRQYGDIVVRRKKALQLFGIRGLEKIETEWLDFNKKYEVFASNHEQATSFELLNPTYMEQLEALGFEVSIEVVDNVIYLYTSERTASVEVYASMLDLLNKAFKEMRL